MKIVFVDTSAWLALINKTDHRHPRAKSVRDDLFADKRLILENMLNPVDLHGGDYR